jgi:hypothetical protein
MRRSQTIDINEVEQYYTITEDGMVWSKRKNRWMKPRINIYGYVFYSITAGTGYSGVIGAFAHTLVALKYIGAPPSDKHEIDHADENKQNNHWNNLEWVTHSENMRRSAKRGRRGYWLGKNRPSPTLETRLKMANAKNKKVEFVLDGVSIVFDSIEYASAGLDTYRKKIYVCIRENKAFRGGTLSFVKDTPPA